MKKHFKTFLSAFIATFVITIGLFQSIAVNADVTTNFWLKGSNGELYTNSGNGRGNAIINVAGCNGCGTGGGEASWGSITGVLSNQTDLNNALTARELIANKSSLTTLGTSNTLYPTQNAVKTYVDGLLVGVFNYRGAYDASGNTFPATGGSGAGGAIQKGDLWVISVAGTLGGDSVVVGDSIIAAVNTPGQTAGNWNILEGNISYVPEDVANKVDNFLSPNNTTYPTTSATFDLFQSTFEGTATQIPYYNTSGVQTSDGLFTRDSNTLFTNISTAINGGDDTVSFLSGEVEPFPSFFLPGVGIQYVAPTEQITTLFGIVDATAFGANKGTFVMSSADSGNTSNILANAGGIQMVVEVDVEQFGMTINPYGTAFTYVDDVDAPTDASGIGVDDINPFIQDLINETKWYFDRIPGSTTGQVLTWDDSDGTGKWQNAGFTYDSVSGNLWSADNGNIGTRNFAITIGNTAGQDADNASELIAIGNGAGFEATNALSSIFIGSDAGSGATNLANTIAIGVSAGKDDINDNSSGDSSILIGNDTSTGGTTNSIAIGTGAVNTYDNQFMVMQGGTSPGLEYAVIDASIELKFGDVSSVGNETMFIIDGSSQYFKFNSGRFVKSNFAQNISNGGTTNLAISGRYASNLYLRPMGGTIASHTLSIPAAPEDGEELTITFGGVVTSLTWNLNGNISSRTLPTTTTKGTSVTMYYNANLSEWVLTSLIP